MRSLFRTISATFLIAAFIWAFYKIEYHIKEKAFVDGYLGGYNEKDCAGVKYPKVDTKVMLEEM